MKPTISVLTILACILIGGNLGENGTTRTIGSLLGLTVGTVLVTKIMK